VNSCVCLAAILIIFGPDMITYTQMLNEDGKMEADITVSKLDDDKYLVIATDTMHRHVETWCKRHLDPEGNKHVTICDVTGGYSQLNIQGPNSRKIMQELIPSEDMSDAAFPFRTAKEVAIGYARVLCARITYVGELGFELHIPTEFAQHVYEQIVAVGAKHNLTNAGLKALASLRMEKAYRDYGHDMDNTDTLLEVGLGFTADFTKKGGFIGIEKVNEQKKLQKDLGGLPVIINSVGVTAWAQRLRHITALHILRPQRQVAVNKNQICRGNVPRRPCRKLTECRNFCVENEHD
jgi:heterotetrameric sarcosine oxidase gamma subunit